MPVNTSLKLKRLNPISHSVTIPSGILLTVDLHTLIHLINCTIINEHIYAIKKNNTFGRTISSASKHFWRSMEAVCLPFEL